MLIPSLIAYRTTIPEPMESESLTPSVVGQKTMNASNAIDSRCDFLNETQPSMDDTRT